MRNYRHSKKHNEFPSFIDFLEGNDTGPFSRVSSDRIAKLTSFVLKLEYDELKILKTITTASIDAMDYLYNLENELDPAENEDESSEGWDEEEAEDSSDNNSGSADEADRDAEKLRRRCMQMQESFKEVFIEFLPERSLYLTKRMYWIR